MPARQPGSQVQRGGIGHGRFCVGHCQHGGESARQCCGGARIPVLLVLGARLAHMDVRVNQPGKLDHAVSSGNRQKKRAMLMALLDKQWLAECRNPTRFGSPAHFRRLDKIQHRNDSTQVSTLVKGGNPTRQDFPARLFLAIIARDCPFCRKGMRGGTNFGGGLPMPPAGNRKPGRSAPRVGFSRRRRGRMPPGVRGRASPTGRQGVAALPAASAEHNPPPRRR